MIFDFNTGAVGSIMGGGPVLPAEARKEVNP